MVCMPVANSMEQLVVSSLVNNSRLELMTCIKSLAARGIFMTVSVLVVASPFRTSARNSARRYVKMQDSIISSHSVRNDSQETSDIILASK